MEFLPLDLDISKKVGNRKIEGEWFLKLGEEYFKTANFQEAIQYFEQYGRICKELEDKAGEGSAYGKLGDTYNSVGNVEETLDFLHKQLKIATEVGDKKSEGRACASLGSVYQGRERFTKALEYYQRHLKFALESGDKAGKGHAYGNLGMFFHNVGDCEKAMEYLELNLTIVKELGDRVGEGTVCGNLGRFHHGLGKFKQAIEYHEMQLSIAKEQNSAIDEACAYYHKGCNLESLGSLNEALACYKSSVRLCNNIRASLRSRKENSFTDEWKINLFDEFYLVNIALCRTLLKLDFVLEALWAVEQGRAPALAHVIQSRYGILTYQPKQEETVSNVWKYISTNTVSLATDNNTINIWLLTPDQGVRFEKATLPAGYNETIRKIIDNFRKHDGRDAGFFRILYDLTIGPLVNQFKGDELVIIPCDQLCLVPWKMAAFDPDSKYRHESLRIRVAPSLTTLKLITDCPKCYHGGVLLVGDPLVDAVMHHGRLKSFERLRFASQEVEMIGKLTKTQPLTGKNATKMAVLKNLRNAVLVHIAAHGGKGMSGIALAPNPTPSSRGLPKEEDFLLTAEDVLKVRARPQLVVLSCCHSGRGVIKNSEGVCGIARAFLAAGARSVLVSLWAIEDEAIFTFMESFYFHLADGRSSSEALNKAMKRLRYSDRFKENKHWAPFVLIGDDVTLEFLMKPPMRLSVSKVYGPIFIPQCIACQDTFFTNKMYFPHGHSMECSGYSSY